MLNKVQIIGRAGQDPEIRQVGDNKVASLSVATSETWKDKSGNKQESTEWFNVEIWGPLAGVVEQYVKKGDLLYLEGKQKTDTWEADGKKHYKTKLVAREMKMLGGGNKEEKPKPVSNPNSFKDEDDLPF